jgi:nitrogen PTS system EIIA component
MELRDVLQPSAVLVDLKAEDKKHILAELSEAASRLTGLRAREIYHALMQRERLGSTGLGRGIAIPHGRMAGVRQLTCLFARLEKPVAYDSLDGEPVDLVFLLLAPEQAGADHLKALAKISRMMRTPATVEMLRANKDRATLYAILTEPEAALSKAG